MSKTYAGRTLEELIEELERECDAARLEGFRAAQEIAAEIAGEYDNTIEQDVLSRIRAMQPPVEWCATAVDAPRNTLSRPTESDWPHPDGFPHIQGMP